MPTSLQMLAQELRTIATQQQNITYALPSLWQDPHSAASIISITNPAEYYSRAVSRLLDIPYGNAQRKALKSHRKDWLEKAVVYSMFIRHTTAFDHDGDGSIALRLNQHGWRETGSFVKSIALLPYVQSLGITTLYLLPLTAIGQVHRKGNLGSPYAIRHPYHIDEQLAEPILNLSADEQCAAFVEACHRCGIRVLCEFALRTTSRDSDWIVEHPDWFYWIEARDTETSFHPPAFSADEVDSIQQKVETKDFSALPPPPQEYRELFLPPPVECWREQDGRIMGKSADGRLCTVPGAFADYPPDDTQPLWWDVTYLRLHTHPDFNYTAYNTLRMYDEQLQQPQWANSALWDVLCGVIPYYKQRFGINGVVLDMSHALPDELRRRIITRARSCDDGSEDESFLLIEENFTIDELSKQLGFDAVVGDTWLMEQGLDTSIQLLQRWQQKKPPIPFLATAETHNTPRVAARYPNWQQAALLFYLNRHLPGGIPTLLSGAELGETLPINTGLGFSVQELQQYSAQSLPLFSAVAMNWLPQPELLRFLQGMYGQDAVHTP